MNGLQEKFAAYSMASADQPAGAANSQKLLSPSTYTNDGDHILRTRSSEAGLRRPSLQAGPRRALDFAHVDDGCLNIIVPMGGIGSRFKKDGYRAPKPLINIVGRPMLMWLIDHLNIQPGDTIWLAHMAYIEADFQIGARIKAEYPHLDIQIVPLHFETRGAAETLYVVCQSMTDRQLARRTVSLDCDTIYFKESKLLQTIRDLPQQQGGCVYFEDVQPTPLFSYLLTDADGRITGVREKVKVSNYANTGAYIFPSASILRDTVRDHLDAGVDDTGEYYTSSVIAVMIKQVYFQAIPIPRTEFFCVGTPKQLEEFLEYVLLRPDLAEKRRFCFDLDSTLVSIPRVRGDYTTCEPIETNIKLVRQLKQAGHYIIISTARRMRTHRGNVNAVVADIGPLTLDSLKKFGIPFDEIHFGKPWAHIYVDDLAVNALLDTHKEIGFHLGGDKVKDAQVNNMTVARSFNNVTVVGDRVHKSSSHEAIEGEIFFYQNCPPELAGWFPAFLSHERRQLADQEVRTLSLDRIDGPTFSHLLLSRCLTIKRFHKLMVGMRALHSYVDTRKVRPAKISKELLYGNYGQKVEARYLKNRELYLSLMRDGNVDASVPDGMLSLLREFEKDERAMPVDLIHGDPVFTNVLLRKDGSIKFIDMRGQLGDVLTMQGDALYDLAKVYQSLRGYDYIIQDATPVPAQDKRLCEELIAYFADAVTAMYGNINMQDITLITASLFFSMIPLHDNRTHQQHFLAKAVALYGEISAPSQAEVSA